jgi:hypothetical protein
MGDAALETQRDVDPAASHPSASDSTAPQSSDAALVALWTTPLATTFQPVELHEGGLARGEPVMRAVSCWE